MHVAHLPRWGQHEFTDMPVCNAVEEELSLIASRGEVYKTKYYSYYVPRGWEPVEMGSPGGADSPAHVPPGSSLPLSWAMALTLCSVSVQIRLSPR